MKLEFETTDDLIKTTEKLMVVLCHERYWTKRWMANFGHTNRTAMDNWQNKADSLIRELQIEDYDLRGHQLAISIKEKTVETFSSNGHATEKG